MANQYESWTDEQLETARVAAQVTAETWNFSTAVTATTRPLLDAIADEQASRAYRRGDTS